MSRRSRKIIIAILGQSMCLWPACGVRLTDVLFVISVLLAWVLSNVSVLVCFRWVTTEAHACVAIKGALGSCNPVSAQTTTTRFFFFAHSSVFKQVRRMEVPKPKARTLQWTDTWSSSYTPSLSSHVRPLCVSYSTFAEILRMKSRAVRRVDVVYDHTALRWRISAQTTWGRSRAFLHTLHFLVSSTFAGQISQFFFSCFSKCNN